MTKASQRALEAYPELKSGRVVYYPVTRTDLRKVYARGYRKAEKDISALIESRIKEIIGDAQPKPILRAELQELIERIKEEKK